MESAAKKSGKRFKVPKDVKAKQKEEKKRLKVGGRVGGWVGARGKEGKRLTSYSTSRSFAHHPSHLNRSRRSAS